MWSIGRDLRRAGDRAAGEHRGRAAAASPTPGGSRALDGRDEVDDAGERSLGHQLGPANRARPADPREVVALEVDDHHVLGGVLLRLAQARRPIRRPRALDRHRPEPARRAVRGRAPATPRRSPSRHRRGDLACRAAASGASAAGEAAGIAPERRGEVLDEVDLVDVAAGDRGLHRLDRGAVVGARSTSARSAPTVKRTGRRHGLPAAARRGRRRAGAGTAPADPATACAGACGERP